MQLEILTASSNKSQNLKHKFSKFFCDPL